MSLKVMPPSAPSLAPLLRGPEERPWEEALPWMRSDPHCKASRPPLKDKDKDKDFVAPWA